MKIVTILGSAQKASNTCYALNLVQDEIKNTDGVDLIEINPAELKLTFPGMTIENSDKDWLHEQLSEADGFILSTPEYHGSFSALLKLTMENMGYPAPLRGKPVGLLGVASGKIGAIKSLEHLRSVCSHMGAIVLPGPVSVANVRQVFDADGNCLDPEMADYIRGVVRRLIRYIRDTTCSETSLEEMVRPSRASKK